VFARLKGTHNGSSKNLNINPEHVSLVFNRQDRVILRMIDGVEIPLEVEYKDANEVADFLYAARIDNERPVVPALPVETKANAEAK
jgi:hypothetical protein